MADRLQALTALKEAVEKGEWPGGFLAIDNGIHGVTTATMYAAFSGSLDAARALHEAVLPGWGWFFEAGGTHRQCAGVFVPEDGNPPFVGVSACPARAWLIAILAALIAQEQADG